MSTLYKSILLAQPANGDVVFVRRFTRDPPVLAQWRIATLDFALSPSPLFTVTGSSHAGTYIPGYNTAPGGTAVPNWTNLNGGIYVIMTFESPPTWTLEITNASSWAWAAHGLTWNGGTISAIPSTQIGSPPIAMPSLLTLTGAAPARIILPATIVQAWRPQ